MTEPVSLSLMRQHLGISQPEDTHRDAIITARIQSARLMAEASTETVIVLSSYTAYSRGFNKQIINLKSPLVSVQSITYLDQDGTRQTLATSQYIVDTVMCSVEPAHNCTWPTVRNQANSVQINYTAGYASTATVPQTIKDAIMFMVGQWEVFQNAIEGVLRPFTIPNAAIQLLQPYRDYREFFGSDSGIRNIAISVIAGTDVPAGYETLLDVNGNQIFDVNNDPIYVLSA